MATNRYALSDYILTIKLPDNNQELLEKSGLSTTQFSIGGPGQNGLDGSFIGSITVKRNGSVWSTEGDATGSWVHSKNLNRTGQVNLDINQVSDDVLRLAMLCNAYESIQDAVPGLSIIITSAADVNNKVATCTDCYITEIPDHKFGEKAADYSWTFTCGRVMFY